MCSRRDQALRQASTAAAAGDAPCDFIRCTHSQPLISRSVSSATPASHAEHSTGSQRSSRDRSAASSPAV